jgi:hypothetical protein
MTQPKTPAGNNGAATQAKEKKPLVPPDEKFWQKYSPHHEAPLSGASSTFLHLAVLGIIVLLGLWYNHRAAEEKPLLLDALAAGEPAGGGGDPNGTVDGAGKVSQKENVEENSAKLPESTKPTPKETLTDVPIKPLEAPTLKEPNGRLVADAQEMERKTKQIRDQLIKNFGSNKDANPKGEGGGGAGGGKDKGIGQGDGPGTGRGGNLDARTKRILRWTLMFNTLNGDDYRKQLSALGAILAVPEPSGEFRVYRNLTPPVTGEVEDITKINRIFWVDDKPESVHSLSKALRLDPEPGQIVAFFPKELEQKLLRLELSYRGLKENQISETRFNVIRSGGSYVPKVVSQR